MHYSGFSIDCGQYIFSVAPIVSYLLALAWHCRHLTQIHKTVGIVPHIGHETAIRACEKLALEESPCYSSNVRIERSHYLVQNAALNN